MIENTLQLHELVMRPLLHDPLAAAQYNDVVGVADGRQSVRNHNRRAAGRSAVQCILHHRLALVVKRRRRLVQQQNARIADQ